MATTATLIFVCMLHPSLAGVDQATVDPQKVNKAARVLGVSSVLEKIICSSDSPIDDYGRLHWLKHICHPFSRCVAKDYHGWVPGGWMRLQSACHEHCMENSESHDSRKVSHHIWSYVFTRYSQTVIQERCPSVWIDWGEQSVYNFDEVIRFMLAGLGFYTQFAARWQWGLSFTVPFCISLVTWAFDLAKNGFNGKLQSE